MDSIYAAVSETPIQWPLSESIFRAADSHGAELVFFGRVRNLNHGRKVIALSYDIFVPLAIETLRLIASEAQQRWGSQLRIAVIHRMGQLAIGDIAVVVSVTAGHRQETYEASRYIIENLKLRAPIWKKEHYEEADSQWLQGHALCGHAGVTTHDRSDQQGRYAQPSENSGSQQPSHHDEQVQSARISHRAHEPETSARV
jgi:molybdopterin synthase catalytic subunit